MTPKTILLVEDDFLNRRLTKKILVNAGYKVYESKNSSEALQLIKTEKIDLAVLDINLGEDELEGITLGQQIKDHHPIPFIYLTAYANIPTLTQATTTKPHSYLTKPFKDIDLIASIGIAVDHASSLQQELISSISVKYQDHFTDLPLNNIDYIESKGNYLLCYSVGKVYRYRSTIKQMINNPINTIFIQIHRAFLVNKNKIEKYNANSVFLKQKTLAVSRYYKKNLFSR